MEIPWPIVIAVLVFVFAILIRDFFSEIIEEEHVFLCIIGVFFVVYVGAALAIGALMPTSASNPDALPSATAETPVPS